MVIVASYPNIIPRNFDSNMGIWGNRGEFLGFSNPTRNPFPSQEGYGFFATAVSMQFYLRLSLAYPMDPIVQPGHASKGCEDLLIQIGQK